MNETATREKFKPAGNRITEQEVAQVLMKYLATRPYGEATYKEIFFDLTGWIELSDEDKEVARSRDAEKKWHAAVRNISAHYDKPGNAIFEGLLVKARGGGFQLASRVRK